MDLHGSEHYGHFRIGEHGEPEFKVSDGYGIPTGIMGFSDVQVTDSAIYAVFHGTSFKEISRQSGRLPDGGKYIYVFSLQGERYVNMYLTIIYMAFGWMKLLKR